MRRETAMNTGPFSINARQASDFASSDFFGFFRRLASAFGFFQCNDTRKDTRRGGLRRRFRRTSRPISASLTSRRPHLTLGAWLFQSRPSFLVILK